MKNFILVLLCLFCANVYAAESEPVVNATEQVSDVTALTSDEHETRSGRIECVITIHRDENVENATWNEIFDLFEQMTKSFADSKEEDEVEELLEKSYEFIKKAYTLSKDEPSVHGEMHLSGDR